MAETFSPELEAPDAPVPTRDPRLRNARMALITAVGVGLLVDLGVQTRAAGAALLTAAVVVVAAFIGFREVTSRAGRVLLAAALLPAVLLFVRTSSWVVIPAMLAVLVLCSLAVALARGGSLFDLGLMSPIRETAATAANVFTAPRYFGAVARVAAWPDNETRQHHVLSVLRGAVVAVPMMAVIGTLLAAGDGVFASLLHLSVDPGSVISHALLGLFGAFSVMALFMRSSESARVAGDGRLSRIGVVEAGTVLAALIAVYGLFAVSRLLVLQRGSEYVLDETGLTYAEYARSGFFQLLWAAGITLVVLLTIRSTTRVGSPRSSRALDALSVTAVGLTLVVVHTAVTRLGIYEDVFGLTMLRLYSTVFAWWIGIVFVLLGISLFVRRQHNWLPAAVMASAFIGLLGVGFVNPERVVVERNVERISQGLEFDVAYAVDRSPDAIPALVDSLPSLQPADRQQVLEELCAGDETPTPWNLSAMAARRSLDEVCAS